MKKRLLIALLLTFSIGHLFFLQSCSAELDQPEITPKTPSARLDPQQYDELVGDLAVAVSNAARNSAEFRQLVKNEVLQQFDGDYDLLLSRAATLQITPVDGIATRSSQNFTIGDMLEHYYPESKNYTRSTDRSIIRELQELYPDLQISIPVHADEWDSETFTPTVCFLPSDYVDLETESVQGYDAQGNVVIIDALNEPDEPVIVIGLNERRGGDIVNTSRVINDGGVIGGGGGGLLPPQSMGTPEVSGVYQNNAVKLSWICPCWNIKLQQFEVYRSGPNDSNNFTLIATLTDVANMTYTDRNITLNKQYVYKVVARAGFKMTTSELVYITTNNNILNKVENLSAEANGGSKILLKWDNPTGESYATRIERKSNENTLPYQVVAMINNPYEDKYIDSDVTPGVRYSYCVRKVDTQGRMSNSAYAFNYATYRNPEAVSHVYLKQIVCDLQAVEGWLLGKPEFYIKVAGMDATLTAKQLSGGCDVQFATRSGTSQTFNNVSLHNWSYFIDSNYYPALTLALEEYDSAGPIEIPITVALGLKLGDVVKLDLSTTIKLNFENKGEYCGESSMFYFEDPERWLYFPKNSARILISELP